MSSTPAERRALVVVAAIAALGVVARVVRARDARPDPTPAEVAALDSQIARVRAARSGGRGREGGGATVSRRAPAAREPVPVSRKPDLPAPKALVDLDVADAPAIEALPWVGPALAARIIEHRERCGPFGSMAALTRVYGIGAGMARRLEPHVTFSTPSRPTDAGQAPVSQGSARSAASRRRGRS